jgi:hypothetical protein
VLVARPVACEAARNSRLRYDSVASRLLFVGCLFGIRLHDGVRETLL